MDFNYYVYNKKAYVSRKELAEKYEMKLSVITFLMLQEEIPNINIDRETFYRVAEASKYLNDKSGKELIWR